MSHPLKQAKSPKNILVIRNDKIGDFILCLPSLYLLRACHPDAKITVLVSDLIFDFAKSLIYLVDEVILDSKKNATREEYQAKLKEIREGNFDASISLFSTFHNAKMLFQSGIKHRFAPRTKLAQIFYNRKLTQRRSQSIKAEYLYNLELIHFFLKKFPGKKMPQSIKVAPPFLKFDEKEVNKLKENYLKNNNIKKDKKLVVIHPGDGGSAVNFSLEQYAELANNLIGDNFHLILSAGPNEEGLVKKLAKRINKKECSFLQVPKLIDYAKNLQFTDLMICGGTGPLHLASALNLNTCGFYPRTAVISKTRWQPINDIEKQLLIEPDNDKHPEDMASINPKKVATEISKLFLMI